MSYGYNFEYYEPGDDSYALLDVLTDENIKNKNIIDLGCSTGVLTDVVKHNNYVVGIDLNIKALDAIKDNISYNLIHTDLFNGINITFFDIIIFNPPYVPDSEEDEFRDKILGGGKDGTEVIDRFINIINNYDISIIYLLAIKANNNHKRVENKISNKYRVEIKKTKKIIGETLIVYKISHKMHNG